MRGMFVSSSLVPCSCYSSPQVETNIERIELKLLLKLFLTGALQITRIDEIRSRCCAVLENRPGFHYFQYNIALLLFFKPEKCVFGGFHGR